MGKLYLVNSRGEQEFCRGRREHEQWYLFTEEVLYLAGLHTRVYDLVTNDSLLRSANNLDNLKPQVLTTAQ